MTKSLDKKAGYGAILRECADIADERQAQYGDAKKNFQETADILKAMFGLSLSPVEIVKVMIAVKWSRQLHKPKKDNLLDATNYTAILAHLES